MSDQTSGSTGRWLKRITQSMSGEPRDLAELIEDLREASIRGLFDGDALVMLEGVLAVADMQVRDIMVPRSQMVFVERDEPPDKLVALVVESGHSRFPVIGEDRDQILGILLAKDYCGCRPPATSRSRYANTCARWSSSRKANGSTSCSRNFG
jgi:magnesium and cobalt transporter